MLIRNLSSLLFDGSNGLLLECLAAAVMGISSHLLYFIHGIRDMQAIPIVLFFSLVQLILTGLLLSVHGITLEALAHLTSIDIAYISALSSSIVIYRLAFHRTRHIPGPFWAKISKTYGLWMARNTHYTDSLQALHKQYGDIVRIGPNEISIARVEALSAVHGPQSRCRKGTLYWCIHYKGVQNVSNIDDKALHKARRSIWDQALTAEGS
jgi:hypothetical protein